MKTNTYQISNEFEGADLGDKRRTKRLLKIADAHLGSPKASYPAMVSNEAELQGFYGFVNNPHIDPLEVVQPHLEATKLRAVQLPLITVIHDTSAMKFKFDPYREGLGYIDNKQRGFFFHPSLALDPETSRPLGLVACKYFSRGPKRKKKLTNYQRSKIPFSKRESARWVQQVRQADNFLDSSVETVHVMDQEADNYEILGRLVEENRRFVIRVHYNRNAKSDPDAKQWGKLEDLLEDSEFVYECQVNVSKRSGAKKPPKGKRAPRTKRKARLHVSKRQVVLKRPYERKGVPDEICLNMVRVWEPNPPKGQEGVEWKLITTESIETAQDVAFIIKVYSSRWIIEEYFKAIKTGCAYAKRELESQEALQRALSITLPVAWLLLSLRNLGRESGTVKASVAFSPRQLEVLRQISKRVKVGKNPTAREAIRAVAGLGGHVSWNGEPGWLVIGRGLEKLLHAEQIWIAAQAAKPVDTGSP